MSTSEERAAAELEYTPPGWFDRTGLGLPQLLCLIAAAGAVGALLRLLIGAPFEEQFMKFPWVTLMINLGGSAALGLLVGAVHIWRHLPGWTVPVVGTGLLGSFTTFSSVMLAAVAVELPQVFDELSGQDVIPPALWEMGAYLVISMLFCTVAASAGLTLSRAMFGETPVYSQTASTATDHSQDHTPDHSSDDNPDHVTGNTPEQASGHSSRHDSDVAPDHRHDGAADQPVEGSNQRRSGEDER